MPLMRMAYVCRKQAAHQRLRRRLRSKTRWFRGIVDLDHLGTTLRKPSSGYASDGEQRLQHCGTSALQNCRCTRANRMQPPVNLFLLRQHNEDNFVKDQNANTTGTTMQLDCARRFRGNKLCYDVMEMKTRTLCQRKRAVCVHAVSCKESRLDSIVMSEVQSTWWELSCIAFQMVWWKLSCIAFQ
jgi:hypothetical protein